MAQGLTVRQADRLYFEKKTANSVQSATLQTLDMFC